MGTLPNWSLAMQPLCEFWSTTRRAAIETRSFPPPLPLEWKVLESSQPAFQLCLCGLHGRCLGGGRMPAEWLYPAGLQKQITWCLRLSIVPVPSSTCTPHLCIMLVLCTGVPQLCLAPVIVLRTCALHLCFTSVPHTCAPGPVSCTCASHLCSVWMLHAHTLQLSLT